MIKATHRGSCQVCGAIQKLPEGVMAKHGYTVRFNFFEGTCHGSGHLSYEKATNLIAAAVERAREKKTSLEAFRASLLKPPTEAKGWRHLYRRFGGGRWTYMWTLVEFRMVEVPPPHVQDMVTVPTRWIPMFVNPDTLKVERLDVYGLYSKDIMDYVAQANKTYAEGDLTKDIARVKQYIVWQQRRIDEWKERDLLPLEGKYKEENQHATSV